MTGGSVPQEAVDQLRATISGETITPVDAAYDAVRQVHNGMIDKRPAVIVRCQNTADIADAVKFAREHDLEISVRGGGHNVAGRAVTDGGLMIDTQTMKGVHVDPATRRVRAQAGLSWNEYNRATAAYGLATTGGVVFDNRHRRPDARWRAWLADGQVRDGRQQRPFRGARGRQRSDPHGRCRAES